MRRGICRSKPRQNAVLKQLERVGDYGGPQTTDGNATLGGRRANFTDGLGSGRSHLFQAGAAVPDRDVLPFGKAGQMANSPTVWSILLSIV